MLRPILELRTTMEIASFLILKARNLKYSDIVENTTLQLITKEKRVKGVEHEFF